LRIVRVDLRAYVGLLWACKKSRSWASIVYSTICDDWKPKWLITRSSCMLVASASTYTVPVQSCSQVACLSFVVLTVGMRAGVASMISTCTSYGIRFVVRQLFLGRARICIPSLAGNSQSASPEWAGAMIFSECNAYTVKLGGNVAWTGVDHNGLFQ
jgi:hypothetical protein